MTYYIVTGRIPFDDEDSLKIVEAETAGKAQEEFKRIMLEENDNESPETGPCVYVNWIIRCGDQEPVIEGSIY